ncbi:MAG: YggS family pyridoxal phosphate-dependent enzyme [bacterium]|nr:YggS family pyridoxal phosphate-dependent enzyme [bacterium]
MLKTEPKPVQNSDKEEGKVFMYHAGRIQENLLKIKELTDKYNSKIVAVSKYYAIDKMIEAYKCGIKDFGESRLPEAVQKINGLDDEMRSDCSYHLIGHLQSNKIKWAVGFFKLIHSVDSKKLADEISKKASELGVKQEILIQVNNSGEEQKFGIAPSQLEDMIEHVSGLENIELKGLMNVAPLTDDRALIKKLFDEMYTLKETYKLKELSMGMSNDYEIALDSGATIVRPGRIIFE